MPKRGKNGWKDSEGNYLMVVEGTVGHQIMWYIPNEGEHGCAIGEVGPDPDDPETGIAHEVAAATSRRYKGVGFVWESEAAAKRALRAINAALLAHESAIPWPEWALKARAEGWSPPKGWTPKAEG